MQHPNQFMEAQPTLITHLLEHLLLTHSQDLSIDHTPTLEPHWHMPHLMVHHLQELPMQDNLEPHIIKLHGMEPLNINLNMLDNHQSIIL